MPAVGMISIRTCPRNMEDIMALRGSMRTRLMFQAGGFKSQQDRDSFTSLQPNNNPQDNEEQSRRLLVALLEWDADPANNSPFAGGAQQAPMPPQQQQQQHNTPTMALPPMFQGTVPIPTHPPQAPPPFVGGPLDTAMGHPSQMAMPGLMRPTSQAPAHQMPMMAPMPPAPQPAAAPPSPRMPPPIPVPNTHPMSAATPVSAQSDSTNDDLATLAENQQILLEAISKVAGSMVQVAEAMRGMQHETVATHQDLKVLLLMVSTIVQNTYGAQYDAVKEHWKQILQQGGPDTLLSQLMGPDQGN